MELLPQELRATLPKLYAQEKNKDPIVHVKFFTPAKAKPKEKTSSSLATSLA